MKPDRSALTPGLSRAAASEPAADPSKTALVTLLCVLQMSMEGLDNNVIAYISPLLRKELDLSVQMVGVIYSVTVFASLAGAILLGPLSDRVGRRPLMILSCAVLSLCSLAMPLVSSASGIICLRFLIGLAFGATVPVTFSLVTEFAPAHRRSFLVMLTSSGVAAGYMLSGIISAAVIPALGWRTLLYGLGAASMIVVAALLLFLPESPAFAARRGSGRMAGASPPSEIDLDACVQPGLFSILRPPYLLMTLLVGITVTAFYGVEFMFGYWLPTLLINQGYSLSAAGYITALGKAGGISGSLAIGWMMDRWGVRRILSNSSAIATVMLGLLPFALGSTITATIGILATGLVETGSFSGSQALAVTAYPPAMRATATGWISGFARFAGGGAGALVGGEMLGAGYGMPSVCLLMSAWMATGLAALVGLSFYLRGRSDGPAFPTHASQ